jgi:hypothetical protein
MTPTLKAARVLLTNWYWALLYPVTILLVTFIVNLVVFAALGRATIEDAWTGGLSSIYIVQMLVTGAGLSQHFSFTVGLGATRRAFYMGLTLVALVQSILFGLFVYLGALLEHATNGWGVALRFFDPLSFLDHHSVGAAAMYIVPLALTTSLGVFVGSVGKRWGTFGFLGLTLVAIVVPGAIAELISLLHGWSEVGSWLQDQTALSLLAGWALVPTVVLGLGGFAVLRRAIP